jgi:hypothetical protein
MILALDTAAQKRFNTATLRLMSRTGWSKRAIRRCAWGLTIVIVALDLGILIGRLGLTEIACLLLCAWTLYDDDRADERAEESQARGSVVASEADEYGQRRKVIGVLGLLLAALCAWVGTTNGLSRVCQFTFQLVWVFQGYLCGVPPQAPSKKRERAPAAVPVAA